MGYLFISQQTIIYHDVLLEVFVMNLTSIGVVV